MPDRRHAGGVPKPVSEDIVAGVDSSTSACKVELRELRSGRLVGSGRVAHPFCQPPRSEQAPDSWEAALMGALADAGVGEGSSATNGYPRVSGRRLVAMSVAAQQHGMVVLDSADRVLRKAKLWNDTESASDSESLVNRLGAQAWVQACGSVPVPAFTVTKLAWLRRVEPEIFAATRSVLLPHDWLTFRLTGDKVTDRGDASGTGYFSPFTGSYRSDLLSLVDDRTCWEELLPKVLGPSEQAGAWQKSSVVVGPGTGDNMAAAIGVGAVPGDLVLSLGTSATAFCVTEEAYADRDGSVAGFCDATGRFMPLVCTLNATKVTDAARRLLGCDHESFDRLALSGPPGSKGLVVVPFFDGERTPNLPRATGMLTGIRSDVEPAEFARAAVEGVVCNLLAAAKRLPLGGSPNRTILVGGGALSGAYRQVVADLTGSEVLAVTDEEVVARGAAIQAAACVTGENITTVAASWPLDDTVAAWPSIGSDTAEEIKAAFDHQVTRLT